VELGQLEPAVTVRGPHGCDVDSDTVESDDAVHPPSLDCRLALQLQTEFDEEHGSGLEVVDDVATAGLLAKDRSISGPLRVVPRAE
jgi:hypothetical protein